MVVSERGEDKKEELMAKHTKFLLKMLKATGSKSINLKTLGAFIS